MAQIPKGGTTKDLTMVATMYDSAKHTNEKTGKTTRWLDVRIAQFPGANPDMPNQEVPSLYCEKGKDGRVETGKPYYEGQVEAMREASGDNVQPLLDKNGEKVGEVFVFNADVMLKQQVINSKTISPIPEGLEVPDNVSEVEFQICKEIREAKAAAKSKEDKPKEAEAPQAEAEAEEQVEAPQADNEPDF